MSKKYTLSFDVATKSFAYVLFTGINTSTIKDGILDIEKMDIQIIDGNVIDIIPGKKIKEVDDITRTKALWDTLHNKIQYPDDFNETTASIKIEFQLGQNVKSNIIYDQTIMYYATYDIEKVGPSLKNQICFSDDLRIQRFYEKYSDIYKANKMHTAANLDYFCQNKKIKFDHIKKSILHNLADAFMQAIAKHCEIKDKSILK